MAHRLGPLALVALAACTPVEVVLATDDARALLLVHVESSTASVQAYALEPGTAVRLAAPTSGRLFALTYATPLGALGLGPGPVVVDPMGGDLPSSLELHLLDDDAWRPLSAPPPDLAAIHLAATARCSAFTVTEHRARLRPATARVRAVVPLDRSRVLVATESGEVFTVGPDGPFLEASLTSTRPIGAAWSNGDGTAWAVGLDSVLRRGTIADGWTGDVRVPLTSSTGWALTGPALGHPLELFATNDQLSVAHFDGAVWRVVRQARPGERGGRRANTSLNWIAPGLAVLTGVGTSSIVEVHAEEAPRVVTVDIPVTPKGDVPFISAYVEGGPALLATRDTSLFERSGDGYVLQPAPPVQTRPDVLVDMGDAAVVMGGQNSVFFERRRDREFCAPFVVGTGDSVRGAARLGDGFVVASETRDGQLLVLNVER